jgi:hypothetical protein
MLPATPIFVFGVVMATAFVSFGLTALMLHVFGV